MPTTTRHQLADALLRAALADLTHSDHARRREARRWLLDDATCETCCTLLGLEVETVRAGVRARVEGGPTMTRAKPLNAG